MQTRLHPQTPVGERTGRGWRVAATPGWSPARAGAAARADAAARPSPLS
jgi:hypothetical protein